MTNAHEAMWIIRGIVDQPASIQQTTIVDM